MMKVVHPDFLEQVLVEPFKKLREATGVSFEKDVLPLAKGEITVFFLDEPDGGLRAREGEDKEVSPFERLSAAAVELADGAKAKEMVEKLAAGGRATKRVFGGLDGWEIQFGEMKCCAASFGPAAYLTLDPEPLDRIGKWAVARKGGLSEQAEFKKAMEWIPQDAPLAAYSSQRKLMRSVGKLVAYFCKDAGGQVKDLPRPESLLADLTPLTAAMKIDSPGFTFEVRSPDGVWAFWSILMAHVMWRTEIEPFALEDEEAGEM
jgi:hypothetical protein